MTIADRAEANASAELLAMTYWRRMRYGAIKEVEAKLTQFKKSSPSTIRFWLAVHACLEKKAKHAGRTN